MNTIHVYSATVELQFYPENKFNYFLCTNAFQVIPPTSHEWLNTLEWVISPVFPARTTLYSTQTLLAGEADGLCIRQMPNHHAHTHTQEKKETNKQNISHHYFFHACSLFMTVSCCYMKYKGTEKKELREVQFKTYHLSDKWKKNLTALCIWKWEEKLSLNFFLFFTFFKSFTSLLTAHRNLFIVYSLYLKQAACPLTAFFTKKHQC